MKIIKKPWFIPIVLTIVILLAGGYYTKHLVFNAETLPENEIRKQLEEAYGGKVERLSLDGTMFEAELSRNKGVYLATVDAETGKVLSLIQTKEVIEEDDTTDDADTVVGTKNTESAAQDKVQTDEATTEPKQTTPSEPKVTTTEPKKTVPPKKLTTVLISEKQAIKIALGQLKGEVEDVEFVQTSEGGYYLVEIDDNKDDEATFQIHAISGEILSVTWED